MRIYHRIDDIREYDEQLRMILDFFDKHTQEFIIAAIPLGFSDNFRDVIGKYQHCKVYQHGYDHFNRVPQGWCDEFPDTMKTSEKRILLSNGKRNLEDILDMQIVGYVPPWNNTGKKTIDIIQELGFKIYSSQENNTHKYWVNRDIDVDIVEEYVPKIVYKDLDAIYSDIVNIYNENKKEELGIMYHFSDTSDEDLKKIKDFIIKVEMLNKTR